MTDDLLLSEPAQRVLRVLARQPLAREILSDRTGLPEAAVLAALSELQDRGWAEHVASPANPADDAWWEVTAAGQEEQQRFQHPKSPPFLTTTLPDGSRVLHPPPQQLRTQVGLLSVVSVLYALLLWGLLAQGWSWGALVLFFLTAVWVALLLTAMSTWLSVIRITPTEVRTRTWYGGRHSTPRAVIRRAVLVHVRGTRTGWLWFLLLDEEGHCLRHLSPQGNSSETRQAFANQFGVPVADLTEHQRSLSQLRREFPGSVSLARLPGIWLLIMLGVLLLAILAVALLLAALGLLHPAP